MVSNPILKKSRGKLENTPDKADYVYKVRQVQNCGFGIRAFNIVWRNKLTILNDSSGPSLG